MKGLEATGYLNRAQSEALGAVGREAKACDEKTGSAAAGTQAHQAREPSSRRLPKCGKDKAPDACWRELSSPAKCELWIASYGPSTIYAPGGKVIWSGECRNGAAHGRGTFKAEDWSKTGEFVEGKRQAKCVERMEGGNSRKVIKGPYVNGKEHGRWVTRLSTGNVIETPYVTVRGTAR